MFSKLRLLFFTFSILQLSATAVAEVWPHNSAQTWNESWETKYSEWIEKSVATDWLQRQNFIFSGWSVYCAKFVYLTRIYFSYANGLEFAILNQASYQKIISSTDSSWDSLPLGQSRVQAFAKSILARVNTSTLPGDTVLIPITKWFVKAGIIVASDRERTHAWLIKKINPSGIPKLLNGTLPGSDFIYEGFVFPPPESIFPSRKLPTASSAGLRRFRWPQDLLKKASAISYSSADQSQMQYETFFDDIQNILKVQPTNSDEEFGYLLDDVCMKVRERVNIIIDAAQAQKKRRGTKFSKVEEDLFSTPKRDAAIVAGFNRIDFFAAGKASQISELNDRRYSLLLNPKWTTADECLIEWADNRIEPLGAIRQRFHDGSISSDPNASFSARWGFAK